MASALLSMKCFSYCDGNGITIKEIVKMVENMRNNYI